MDYAKEGAFSNDKKRFRQSVGIVFIEALDEKSNKYILNFDQLACAHFLLQMNRAQSVFDFQVITIQLFESFSLPTENTEDLLKWLDGEVFKFENSEEGKDYGIDYWFGITRFLVIGNLKNACYSFEIISSSIS